MLSKTRVVVAKMAIIQEVLGMVDTTVGNVASTTYADIVNAIEPVVASASILVVILVAINIVTQTVPMNYGTALSLGLRIVLVNIFLIFGNLETVYDALTNAPSEIGTGFLSALSSGTVSNLYEGLDDLYLRALDIGQAVSQNGGFLAGALTSVFVFLIAAAMATITIIVLSAAKIMLAVLISIAPVAIACTLFKQSAPIFEAWVKLAIGFAFVPLLVAAMAGFTIAAGDAVIPGNLDDVETLGDVISFIVIMMLGAGLMVLVPTFAQSLAATNIGIAGIAGAAAGYPGRVARGAGSAMRGADDFRRGASAGLGPKGTSVSDRSSTSARVGNYSARAVTSIASKMKKG